jgi:flagellar hook-basal body complex protein FliE
MSLNVSAIQPLSPIRTEPAAPVTRSGESSFKDVLSSAIDEVEGARSAANKSVEQFLAGEGGDLHSTILASQRAELEFQMFLQVRNKVVSAYQEVMRMQM